MNEPTANSPIEALANANWLPWPRKPIGKRPYKGLGPKPAHNKPLAIPRKRRPLR